MKKIEPKKDYKHTPPKSNHYSLVKLLFSKWWLNLARRPDSDGGRLRDRMSSRLRSGRG